VRWQYRDAGLLWPFVPAFALHVAEEWFADFPSWTARLGGRAMPDAAFLAINAVALLLLIYGIVRATRHADQGWIAVTIATIAIINLLAHAAGAAITRSYMPGLFTAVIFYVPLGSLTMIRAIDQASPAQLRRGAAWGVVLHALVFVAAFAATRLS
jgi:hypothetical protein